MKLTKTKIKTGGSDTTLTHTPAHHIDQCQDVLTISGYKHEWLEISEGLYSLKSNLQSLPSVPNGHTRLHVFQLKSCMHFSSFRSGCILSSSYCTVLIRDWNYYNFYLSYKINTVIISSLIYRLKSFDSVQIMLPLLDKHYIHTPALKIASVIQLWLFEFYNPFSAHHMH
jgi:hypothetical protein